MIAYTIKKSTRAKNVRITIRPDETVTVTIPHMMDIAKAEAFIEEKREWIKGALDRMSKRSKPTHILPKASIRDYKAHRDEALRLAVARLEHWNAVYGFSWKTVSIKNTSSRWGSCSRLGNLNFSYRIVFLPPHLQDYLVVHELCHRGQMNHSAKFWKLVSLAIPEYVDARKTLKRIP